MQWVGVDSHFEFFGVYSEFILGLIEKKVGRGVEILKISSFFLHSPILSPLQTLPPSVVSTKLMKRKAEEKVGSASWLRRKSGSRGGRKKFCSMKNDK